MPKSSRRPRRDIRKSLPLVGLGALALVTAGVVAFAVGQEPSAPPVGAASAPAVSFSPAPEATVQMVGAVPVAEVVPALADPAQNFTLTVVGDSTGFPRQGWVEATMRQVRAATGRTISMRTWNQEKGEYDAPRVFGSGEPTLIVWNGSAPGRDAGYSVQNLDALMPEPSDLVIVNHGHNIAAPAYAEAQLGRLFDAIRPKLATSTAVLMTTQNPETGPGVERQKAVTDASKQTAERYGVEVLDPYAAYEQRADMPALLMPDGVHPNEVGYRVWAELVTQKLGFQFDPAVS